MADLTVFDTAFNDQFPAGAAAYAGYVGDQPNDAYVARTFPKARHLSVALSASDNADALDVEAGAATASDHIALGADNTAQNVAEARVRVARGPGQPGRARPRTRRGR